MSYRYQVVITVCWTGKCFGYAALRYKESSTCSDPTLTTDSRMQVCRMITINQSATFIPLEESVLIVSVVSGQCMCDLMMMHRMNRLQVTTSRSGIGLLSCMFARRKNIT
jgi:hypothetical protein